MRIPKMQASPQYRVTIPKLDGGVNLKDAPHLVEDNQLTNVCNMWWQDQALRTRPGLKTETNSIYRIETNERVSCSDGVLSSIGGCPAMAVFSRINMGTVLVSVYKIQPDGGREQVGNPIYLPTDEDVNSLRIMFVESDKKASGNGLYIFFNVGLIFEWNGSDEWAQLSDDDMYVPTVLVSGKGTYTDGEVGEPNGTFFEGYNMLTGRFRSLYTTDGKGKTFWLPQKGLDNSKITAKYTDSKGTVHAHTINANTSMETAAQADGLVLMADRTAGYVYFTKDRVSPTPVPSANITNNLEVVASKDDAEAFEKITNMSMCTWFGGDRSGINGGTRLFVSGNPSEPNLVHWSDVNNPLYFPENNYARIGNSGMAVTAFGKQENILVVFKESEIYYATYVAGGDFTAQDVIDGKVVDVAANMAKFPITPIHSSVGCDCPNTVSLCNNRLIWATSGKKVYTLTSANQYSERNVFELSDAIQPELNGWDESLMKEYAFSVDWDGNYFLFCLDKAVVFNYGGNAFANISSYADPKKSQRYMGWYIWAFVDYAQAIKGYVFGGVCQLIGRGQKIYIDPETGQRESYDFLVHYHFGGMSDTALYYDEITGDTPIHSMFQTKLFDFGRPERRKNVRKLHIGATDVADGYITLSYVTEFGTQEDAYRIGMYGDGDMRVWAVTPHVNRIRRFGIRADSAGAMAVDGMVIRYEVYGEVR